MSKGLTVLNREAFRKSFQLVALRIPSSQCNAAMQKLQGDLIDLPRLRAIVEDPQAKDSNAATPSKLLLLRPSITEPKLEALPSLVQEFAKGVDAEVTQYTLDLGFEYWTADQILRSILPDELDIPSSFEMIGHIAHVNLRSEYLPYKKLVGEVLLDASKNKYIRTVVNKTDSIDHTFRFFKMELLAGEDNMITEVKESGCRFRFDFSSVYWNSRLQGEHRRLVNLFKKDDRICDVMAGVGPFAVPAAKNGGCLVFANDLNPVSYQYLGENIAINKVGHLVRAYNMDGRDFVHQALKDLNNPNIISEMNSKRPPNKKSKTDKRESKKVQQLPDIPSEDGPQFKTFQHYVMNLPATAIEFLDAYQGLYHGLEDKVKPEALPIIHCHCFSKEDDCEADVLQRAEAVLGTKLGENLVKIHRVRDVAPKKEMLCISFRLPKAIAFGAPRRLEKRKIDEISADVSSDTSKVAKVE
ncbi:tRNA (guanine(37)-N1)-methyltransferase [Chytridiales sp. JEL 0842]|nr:tRNA (guanine(37)-N1)-methyltransferase [Chytridiales sp. JEL 0842]